MIIARLKKSSIPEIVFFVLKNMESPQNSGRFGTSGSPVALFVAEILPSRFFVTRTERTRMGRNRAF